METYFKHFSYQTGELRALVVAVIHEGRDWACYIGATEYSLPTSEAIEVVSRKGHKLHEEIARAYFPCVEERYRK